jgi:hypothetical protein
VARRKQLQEERARLFAIALASFCRAQAALPLPAVAESPECVSLVSELLALVPAEKPAQGLRKVAGRHRVHDRNLARSALLDFVSRHPDGMVHQAALIRELERRFQTAGYPVPGETWLKSTVREFQSEVEAFELDAADTFRASQSLQAVFSDLDDFLRFRRAKGRAMLAWQDSPEIRAQFASAEKLLEAALHNGFPQHRQERINAHLRLASQGDAGSTLPIRRRTSA